jgi:hypothetical protein
MHALHADERGVVAEWLLRLLVSAAVLGVMVFDAGAIAVNYVTLDGTANDIAVDLSTEVVATNGAVVDRVLAARAEELAGGADARLLEVSVDDQGVVHVRIARSANTLVVKRIASVRSWGRAEAEGRASTR